MGARNSAPLSDAIVVALGRLVDDALTETREPSHSDIEFLINRAGASPGDPKTQGQPVGKAKRVRASLGWALEHNPAGGEQLVASLIAVIRAVGGFRPSSPNYAGSEVIRDAINVFRSEGYELSLDGEMRPLVLDGLSCADLTEALEAYVRRAKRGAEDAALLASLCLSGCFSKPQSVV
jgi:hypothetical protein